MQERGKNAGEQPDWTEHQPWQSQCKRDQKNEAPPLPAARIPQSCNHKCHLTVELGGVRAGARGWLLILHAWAPTIC